jgi:hypothetical protein
LRQSEEFLKQDALSYGILFKLCKFLCILHLVGSKDGHHSNFWCREFRLFDSSALQNGYSLFSKLVSALANTMCLDTVLFVDVDER